MATRNSHERFLTDKRDNFTQLVAVNVALLLGLAMAFLTGFIGNASDLTLDTLARGACTILVSVWITMEYFFYNTINRRNQEWIDGGVLYLLGMGQVACALYVLNGESWTLAALAMALMGIAAYGLQFRELESLATSEITDDVKAGLRMAILYCGGGFLILLASVKYQYCVYALFFYYLCVAWVLQRHTNAVIKKADKATREESEKEETLKVNETAKLYRTIVREELLAVLHGQLETTIRDEVRKAIVEDPTRNRPKAA